LDFSQALIFFKSTFDFFSFSLWTLNFIYCFNYYSNLLYLQFKYICYNFLKKIKINRCIVTNLIQLIHIIIFYINQVIQPSHRFNPV
jgi:hypothetical protein